MKPHTTNWRIPPVAWVGIALAFSAEAAANALRAYGLGAHETQFTIYVRGHAIAIGGIVMVLAALALSLSQSRAAWVALKPGDPQRRIMAALVALVLIAVSACAMSSHMLAAMRSTSGDETHDRKAYDRAETAYKNAKRDYETVKTAETVAAVEARIAALNIDANIWRRTNGCTEVKRQVHQDECRSFTKAQPSLAAAHRKAELEAKLPALQAALDKQKRPNEQTDAEAFVNEAWSWLAALAIILVATVGPALFATEIVETAPESVETFHDHYRPGPPRRPVPPNGGNRRPYAFTKQAAEADVIRLFRDNGSIPSQETLSQRWHVGKGTVSKWVTDFERRQLINRETVGRCKTVVPFKQTA